MNRILSAKRRATGEPSRALIREYKRDKARKLREAVAGAPKRRENPPHKRLYTVALDGQSVIVTYKGKSKRWLTESFIYGQRGYESATAKYPRYVHREVSALLRRRSNEQLRAGGIFVNPKRRGYGRSKNPAPSPGYFVTCLAAGEKLVFWTGTAWSHLRADALRVTRDVA